MTENKAVYQPTAIVIFGGTGNLAETKLLPSLFKLYTHQMLPEAFKIIGLSRKNLSDTEYREYVANSIAKSVKDIEIEKLNTFCSHIVYASGSFDDLNSYLRINDLLNQFDETINQCTSKLFYLAVPPSLYAGIFANLKASNAMALCDGVDSWSRLLVEKPFGQDLDTAQALEKQLMSLFSENQIYRIDHYLAKDSIENIISLRFANSILSDSWNGAQIEDIKIKLFEDKDVSTRGAFYDGMGALRDVGQNHMLQMLALLTMSPVDVHSAEKMRQTRLDALKSVVRLEDDILIRAQYKGYQGTVGVAEGSQTETYFKIGLHINNDLWKNLPVILESGKALKEAVAEAIITFKPTDLCYCHSDTDGHQHRNVLKVTFSPEQRIELTMWIKEPGFGFKLHERKLVLNEYQGEEFRSPEAYERVLYDCIIGDQTRFVSGAEIEAAWGFITPILEEFKSTPLHTYNSGEEVYISEN